MSYKLHFKKYEIVVIKKTNVLAAVISYFTLNSDITGRKRPFRVYSIIELNNLYLPNANDLRQEVRPSAIRKVRPKEVSELEKLIYHIPN